MNKKLVAKWQSRRGKHYLELYQDEAGFTYTGDRCGGNLGNITLAQAIDIMETKIQDSKLYDGINMKSVLLP